MISYKLEFISSAWKEWQKLNPQLQLQFHKKLEQRLENPHIASAKLTGMRDCYKIKLRDAGYRLVYRVFDGRLVVQVVAVGKRDKNTIYKQAEMRQ